jgi:hypothetical protein
LLPWFIISALLVGCGYTRYYEPSADHGKVIVWGLSAYIMPYPSNAVQFAETGLTVACLNQEFDLALPIPGPSLFHSNYKPRELEILFFFNEPHTVRIDLSRIELPLEDKIFTPDRAEYLPQRGDHKTLADITEADLEEPLDLHVHFNVKAGDVKAFRLVLPTILVDGKDVSVPEVSFKLRGSVAYLGD